MSSERSIDSIMGSSGRVATFHVEKHAAHQIFGGRGHILPAAALCRTWLPNGCGISDTNVGRPIHGYECSVRHEGGSRAPPWLGVARGRYSPGGGGVEGERFAAPLGPAEAVNAGGSALGVGRRRGR